MTFNLLYFSYWVHLGSDKVFDKECVLFSADVSSVIKITEKTSLYFLVSLM